MNIHPNTLDYNDYDDSDRTYIISDIIFLRKKINDLNQLNKYIDPVKLEMVKLPDLIFMLKYLHELYAISYFHVHSKSIPNKY